MSNGGLFDGTIQKLCHALDLRSIRHNMIVSNLANMDIPAYKPFDLVIREEMGKDRGEALPLLQSQPGHMALAGAGHSSLQLAPAAMAMFTEDSAAPALDREQALAALAQNGLVYNATAQIVARKFDGLRNVVEGGRE
ncbi:putative Flagellar basal body rod protein FlgB [uncultured Desulfatiglans sp.]|nr:putative Flagellar basal body rod protein FlgB [uncultured Desulfatiglans sp.]